MTKLMVIAGLALALCGCTERAKRTIQSAPTAAASQPDVELVVDAAPR